MEQSFELSDMGYKVAGRIALVESESAIAIYIEKSSKECLLAKLDGSSGEPKLLVFDLNTSKIRSSIDLSGAEDSAYQLLPREEAQKATQGITVIEAELKARPPLSQSLLTQIIIKSWCIGVCISGYRTYDCSYADALFELELYNKTLSLLVWDDVNNREPLSLELLELVA